MKKINVVSERFRSLDHLLFEMEERPTNKAFSVADKLSSERKDRPEWYKTASYSDAMELMRTGYTDPLEQMKQAILKIGQKENYKRPNLRTEMQGFIPNVPAYLMNLPETMLNRPPKKKRANTIHLSYAFCASASTSSTDLIEAGVNFISLVNSLEKQKYRVKIDLIFATLTEKTCALYSVMVKNYGDPLNLLKLAFPLVHPSMLRRVSFKWLETSPDVKDRDFLGGYGVPISVKFKDGDKERELLRDHGVLSDNMYYCNVYQALEAKSPSDLASTIGIK